MPVPDRDDVVGKPTTKGVIKVERGPVSNFATALKDENEIYHDEGGGAGGRVREHPCPAHLGVRDGPLGQVPRTSPTTTRRGAAAP